ncbi:helix-turn-helix domain-containing protein [Exilibacterium tricleocarpae]|uniref:Helix-turn-helix domain-containing protein n=1 Tax=Exilibacterium tricleocarpae TaxID=2591008 RepID=A0A545UBE0_9GAMM|nr:AraC family transcriptional regulator [Exilibacterium tricleocarpae]TQV86786.1 helix-turn-helix domain-containing protein [Exilibacterium tricleocarpae]
MSEMLQGLPDSLISMASDNVLVAITRAKPFVVEMGMQHCALLIPLALGKLSVTDHRGSRLCHSRCPFTMTFLPPGSHVKVRQTAAIEHIYISVATSHLKDLRLYSLYNQKGHTRPVIGYSDPDIPMTAQSLRRHMLAPHYTGPIYLEALASVLLTHAVTAIDQQGDKDCLPRRLSDDTLKQIIEQIDNRLGDGISIRDLAAEVNMPLFTFTRLFKTTTGQSPYQYILERRIGLARRLLSHSELSLAGVAYSSGFASQSHMTDIFRQKLGITPGSYRRGFNK